jgi:hypothetical protein
VRTTAVGEQRSTASTGAERRALAIVPLAHLHHDRGTGPMRTARLASLSLVRPPVHGDTPREAVGEDVVGCQGHEYMVGPGISGH